MNPANKRRQTRLAIILILQIFAIPACQKTDLPVATPVTAKSTVTRVSDVHATHEEVGSFCGACHKVPIADMFPKSAWYDEVKRGFDFYHEFKRKDLNPPQLSAVVEYFRARAPESFEFIHEKTYAAPDWARFRSEEIMLSSGTTNGTKPIAISFVSAWARGEQSGSDLLLSDMANGGVYLLEFRNKPHVSHRLADLKNPAAAHRCDLNGNGRIDLVVADLGSFNPADHDQGRVHWIPDVEDSASNQQVIPLIEGLGRVADANSADFDGDGDQDLIIAEFGWHLTGRILLLRNDGDVTRPKFTSQLIDPRPGAIHVPVVDLNRDGKPDFIALISQQFEVIEAFENRGDGTFEKKTLRIADDPSFGSSGIQVVDLDGDGDDDVLYTNGDSFDSHLVKPYHGIQWLENTGQFPFVNHRLTAFAGVHRALAGDLDRDGDLDIVACSFLPTTVAETQGAKHLDSLIWLEQVRPGEFIRHRLETGNGIHPAMELSDIDGDGDLDLAVGSFRVRGSGGQSAVTIWWNEIPKQD